MTTRKKRVMPKAATGEAANEKTVKTGAVGGRKAAGRPRGKAKAAPRAVKRVKASPMKGKEGALRGARTGAKKAAPRAEKKAAPIPEKKAAVGQAGAGVVGRRRPARLQARKRACAKKKIVLSFERPRKPKIWEDEEACRRADEFVELVKDGFRNKEACLAVGIDWGIINRMQQHREGFAERLDEAWAMRKRGKVYAEVMDTHEERGLDGWEEPVFHQGKQTDKRRVFSERSMEVLTRATMPEIYRERLDANLNGSFRLVNNTDDPAPLPPDLARPAPGDDKP